MYIQVNIGRNIGNTPMPVEKWQELQGRVMFVISVAAFNWEDFDLEASIETHLGTGSYNGITEESAHISSYWEEGFDIEYLKKDLAKIRDWFEQDTIALIVGSELI